MSSTALVWEVTKTWEESAATFYAGPYVPGGENQTKSIRRTRSRWVSETVDYDLRDGRGRAIGGYAIIDAFQRLVGDSAATYALAPETTFFVTTQATRDGTTFGAISVHGTKCSSFEDAVRVAEKKIADAKKRFARAVAKGDGKQFRKAVRS